MPTTSPAVPPVSPAFRIDRFDVPRAALAPFMARLKNTQNLLGGFEGCRQNLVLQGPAQGDSIAVVTVVEWASEDAMAAAKAAMQAHYAREAFEPAAFMQALGVRPDLAVYHPA
ncbi:antibiotic biosynthesis monooxygenase [Aquabacterium sp.]|uniref:antibiotic biosynthesis monooxygenase n=1 Tax=Aquabacterium sp. TaxID=1872578 RepID=UPI0037834A31